MSISRERLYTVDIYTYSFQSVWIWREQTYIKLIPSHRSFCIREILGLKVCPFYVLVLQKVN